MPDTALVTCPDAPLQVDCQFRGWGLRLRSRCSWAKVLRIQPMGEFPQSEQAIFEAALRLAPKERVAYLDQACGDDSELRQRIIETLFKASQQTGIVAEGPAPGRR